MNCANAAYNRRQLMHMTPKCRVYAYMLSSEVLAVELVFGLAEDNILRHRTSWLLHCAPSSETIADSLSSNGQLTFLGMSTFFSIAPH